MRSDERGVSLVEILVGISISIVVSLGLLAYVSRQSDLVAELKNSIYFRQLAKKIENQILKPEIIAASAEAALYSLTAGNKALLACITKKQSSLAGGAICEMAFTDVRRQVPFDLVLPVKHDQAILDANVYEKRTISGGERAIYYTKEGKLCGRRKKPECVLAVHTYFWASCAAQPQKLQNFISQSEDAQGNLEQLSLPDPDTSCLQASAINIRYQIKYIPEPGKQVLGISTWPSETVFRSQPTFNAFTHEQSDLPQVKIDLSCEVANETIVKVENGVATCACLEPFIKIKSDLQEICTLERDSCLANQRNQGVDEHGRVICVDVATENSTLSRGCSHKGAWIEKVSRIDIQDPASKVTSSGCKITPCPTLKKGDGSGGHCTQQVECDLNIRCVWEQS